MTYTAKVAVCSDIRTKHSTQSEHHVEFFIVKTWRYVKKPSAFKRLIGRPSRQSKAVSSTVIPRLTSEPANEFFG